MMIQVEMFHGARFKVRMLCQRQKLELIKFECVRFLSQPTQPILACTFSLVQGSYRVLL